MEKIEETLKTKEEEELKIKKDKDFYKEYLYFEGFNIPSDNWLNDYENRDKRRNP